MPTYAYRCTECDHSFDFVQSFSDDPLTMCPECSGRLRKVYGSIGVTFKGIEQGLTADGFPYLGKADAPITLTDYSDFL